MLVYFHVSSSLVMLGMVTLTQLFAHEIQATPPSLSENESLKLPKKIINFVLSFTFLSLKHLKSMLKSQMVQLSQMVIKLSSHRWCTNIWQNISSLCHQYICVIYFQTTQIRRTRGHDTYGTNTLQRHCKTVRGKPWSWVPYKGYWQLPTSNKLHDVPDIQRK